EGRISLDQHVNMRGDGDEAVIRLAALNSVYQTGLRSPMDEAILRHEHPAVAEYTRIDEVPFDWERRCVSVVVQDGRRRLLSTKGAAEGVVPRCGAAEVDGAAAPLDAAARAAIDALFHRLGAEGYRALAVAYREIAVQPGYTVADEQALV